MEELNPYDITLNFDAVCDTLYIIFSDPIFRIFKFSQLMVFTCSNKPMQGIEGLENNHLYEKI